MRYCVPNDEVEKMNWLDKHATFNEDKKRFELKCDATEEEKKIFKEYVNYFEELKKNNCI